MAQSLESHRPDFVCWSRVRFDNDDAPRTVQLVTRFARSHRAFFIEEPVDDDGPPRLAVRDDPSGVTVVVPLMPSALVDDERDAALRELFSALFASRRIVEPLTLYGSPLFLAVTDQLGCGVVVYDCASGLFPRGFADAPRALRQAERELLGCADVVITDDRTLFEARRGLHADVHPLVDGADDVDLDAGGVHEGVDDDHAFGARASWDGVFLRLRALIDDASNRRRHRHAALARPAWPLQGPAEPA